MKTEQPREWSSGQLAQAIAQYVMALGTALLVFEPTKLVPLLSKNGTKLVAKLQEATAAFMAELTFTLLPHFTKVLGATWKVLEDGTALPANWDPAEFFAGLKLACVHGKNRSLTGEELIKLIRRRMVGRREFDQHVLAWLREHWDDPRIPAWFRRMVESEEVVVMLSGTILQRQDGVRYGLCLCWSHGQPQWDHFRLDINCNQSFRGLVCSGSAS